MQRVAALQYGADRRPHLLRRVRGWRAISASCASLELAASLDVIAVGVVAGGDEHQVRPELQGGGHGDVL